jgi:hypothetical protein
MEILDGRVWATSGIFWRGVLANLCGESQSPSWRRKTVMRPTDIQESGRFIRQITSVAFVAFGYFG